MERAECIRNTKGQLIRMAEFCFGSIAKMIVAVFDAVPSIVSRIEDGTECPGCLTTISQITTKAIGKGE